MAEEIGVAYLSIAPSLKDFKSKLESAVRAQSAAVGVTAGQSLGSAAGATLSRSTDLRDGIVRSASTTAAINAYRAAGAKAGATVSAGVAQATTAGVATQGARMKDVFRGLFTAPLATIRGFAQGAGAELDAIGGKSVALRNLGSNAASAAGGLKSLAAKSTSLQAVRQAASGALGSLGGVSSLLGAAGPWGIALAGAGLALNGFSQAQENARAAVDALTGSLDEQTGSLTTKSLEQIATALRADITGADEWQRLNEAGFGLDKSVAALRAGGSALDDYRTRLQQIAGSTSTLAPLAQSLDSSLQNQSEVMADASDKARAHTEVLNAVKAATASTTPTIDAFAVAMNALPRSTGAVEVAMDRLDGAIGRVRDKIAGTPREVVITAKGIGFEAIIAAARSAREELLRLAQVSISTESIAIDGERHGLEASKATGVINGDSIGAIKARSRKTIRDFRKTVADHNTEAQKIAADAAAKSAKAADDAARKAAEAAAARQQKLIDTISSTISNAKSAVTPNITELPKTAPGIRRALQRTLVGIRTFRANLTRLAKRGLPQSFLSQLISAGLDGASTAQALVNAKDADFASIKKLSNRIDKQSTGLGRDSLTMLYGTGKNAIKGLINGMDSGERELDRTSKRIARHVKANFDAELGPRKPGTAGMTKGKGGSAGSWTGGKSSLIVQGDIKVYNPVGETTSRSVTQGLRKAAFLLGA